ncbi:hypothetical protein BS78_02G127600 [Paspalum vaginatum]|nr:hypothetical protein BS78_02G127600 [Paspalum vaginatum]
MELLGLPRGTEGGRRSMDPMPTLLKGLKVFVIVQFIGINIRPPWAARKDGRKQAVRAQPGSRTSAVGHAQPEDWMSAVYTRIGLAPRW